MVRCRGFTGNQNMGKHMVFPKFVGVLAELNKGKQWELWVVKDSILAVAISKEC